MAEYSMPMVAEDHEVLVPLSLLNRKSLVWVLHNLNPHMNPGRLTVDDLRTLIRKEIRRQEQQ